MKTRNEIYGGTFSSPEAPDTNANGELKKLVLSDNADITKNRSSWIRTIFYNIMDSFTHKTEDRATSANLGVSGAEPITTKYVTVEQLPFVDKTTNDFTGSAGSGSLINNQNTITISTILTGTAKQFVASLHTDFVAWLLARTWLQSELEALITDTATPLIEGAILDIPYVAPTTYTGSELTPFVINSLTYVNVPNVLFTNSANTTKYLVSFTYTVFIATNAIAGETNGVVVKVFNEDTAGIYDESEFQLGAVTTSANTKTQGSFQSILTLSPTHRIRLAAKCTGSLEAGEDAQTISNVRFSILEIK